MLVEVLALGVPVDANVRVESDLEHVSVCRYRSARCRTTSPPQRSRRCASLMLRPSDTTRPRTRSFSEVSFQSRSAKAGSSIWKRSFTRTASPFLGLPGVVVYMESVNIFKMGDIGHGHTSGRDARKDT